MSRVGSTPPHGQVANAWVSRIAGQAASSSRSSWPRSRGKTTIGFAGSTHAARSSRAASRDHPAPPVKYRPDIDGLRAVAVAAVVLFHAGYPWASGGFVGVDVFFVISGFLITRLIKDEVSATGGLSFSRFYTRRARRLFPALFFTLAVSFGVALMLLSPHDLERFGGALLHSITSLSNVYFWTEAGYFDAEATAKPLLHTWSLSVEEQFYLVWPVTLFLLTKGRRKFLAPAAIIAAGVVSLYLNQWMLARPVPETGAAWYQDARSTIYFLAPFRVFEFSIGAILAWADLRKPRSSWLREAFPLAGLALIGYAVVTFDETTVFPSFAALIPCVGSALVIYSHNPRFTGRLLANKPMVGIGLISYSLYLAHWPLIVFWKYYTFRDLTAFERVLLPLLSIVLGALMYRFVERPFRSSETNTLSGSAFGLVCALLALVLVVPAANAWAKKGWGWRLPEELYQSVEDLKARRAEYWSDWTGNVKEPGDFSSRKVSVVVIGDSFALDVVNMIREERGFEVYYDGSTGWNCKGFTLPAKRCAKNRKKFAAGYEGADVVVLADEGSTWKVGDARLTRATLGNVKLLRDHGFAGPIVIYGERPRYSTPVHRLVLRFGRLAGAGRYAGDSLIWSVEGMNGRIEAATAFYEGHGIHYFSPVRQLCREDWCDVLTPNGKLIYFDGFHFTWDGVGYLKSDFIPYLRDLLER